MRRSVAWLTRGGLLVCGVLLVMSVSGCSLAVKYGYNKIGAERGYDWADIEGPRAVAEAQERFGKPAASSTCPDGSLVDTFHLTGKPERPFTVTGVDYSWWTDLLDTVAVGAVDFASAGLAELFLTPLAVQDVTQREKQRPELRVAFVYGADGNILYRFAADSPAELRFERAMRPLSESLRARLAESACPSWAACLTSYVDEGRQRATCVGDALTDEDERKIQRLQAIGKDVDDGRVASDVGRTELQSCIAFYSTSGGCLR